jgi:hypothetical protein
MKRYGRQSAAARTFVLSSVLWLAGMATGTAQPIRSAPAATTSPAPSAAAQSITVHGRWTIVVRNPDGTVATHVQFENSLCPTSSENPGGDRVLAYLLSGATPGVAAAPGSSVAGWYISLGNPTVPAGSPVPAACNGPEGTMVPSTLFLLVPTTSSIPGCTAAGGIPNGIFDPVGALCFTALTTPPVGGALVSGAYVVTLAAQFTVPSTSSPATVSAVGTTASLCVSACTDGGPAIQFTGAYLTGTGASPAPIKVVGGQAVSVTVQIGFQ